MKIDASPWPLIVLTMSGELREGGIEPLLKAFDEDFLRRGQEYVVIADTRAVTRMPDPLWRAKLTRWMNDPGVRAKVERYNVGTVTIFSSHIMKSVYTALTWIWRAASPQHAAVNMGDALAWCRAQLEKAKVPITPEFSAFCRANGVSSAR